MPAPAQLRHRPSLDALRGLAVLVVVAFHSELGIARGGYLGVSTFFTLSGFLITTLLLVEHHNTGGVRLGSFWRRRFRRLLPAAIVLIGLVVVVVAVVGDPGARSSIGPDAIWSVFYGANWHQLLSGTSYADLFAQPSPLVHMWSLAVEEQFYVVFPLVVVLLVGRMPKGRHARPPRLQLRGRLVLVALGMIAVSLTIPLLAHTGVDRTYYGTDTRMGEIAFGVLLAAVVFPILTRADARPLAPSGRRALAVLSCVAAAVMVAVWVLVPQTAVVWTKGGFLLYGLGSALLVAAAALEVGPVGRLGLARPLCRLGLISYGVYLIHWPVLWLLDNETDWGPWTRFAVTMGVSVTLAELSMRHFEMPIRRDGRLAGKRAGALIPLAAAAALAGALVLTSTAPPPVIDFAAAAERVNSTIPTPTDTSATAGVVPVGSSSPLRVAVFGDSTALMTGFGLGTAAAADGRVVGVPGYAHMGCGLMIADQVKNAAGTVSPMPHDCTDWPQVWSDRAVQARPDVALVQVGPWETYDLKWVGVDGWHHLGDPVADAKARSLLQEAVDDLSATGARVAFVTASHVDRRTTVGEACACPERLDRLNELMREVAAANPDRASVIDLAGWLESVGDEDLRLRPDGVHFSEQTAAEVSRRYLLDQIVGLPPGPGRADQPGTNNG